MLNPLELVANLIKTGLDKFVGDKMDEVDRKQLESDMIQFVSTQAFQQNSDFRKFIVEYEGAAKDVPKLIVYFRSLIRPIFTCLVGYLDFLYFTSATMTGDQADLLKAVNIIVLTFWFGERAITNSGIIDKLLSRKES
ncbi:hypothetical protein LCGC14_1224000 [marine sediment metagenome]|uniref:Uncharacterized protein n=1 Tax=marine sediment metagenome TaxID=412755 RepID=A0A0F9PEW7_9ZZZZ